MNLADFIVIIIIIGVLGIITYFTRTHKKNSGCASCHNDCASCHSFSNLYQEYKQGEQDQ